LNSDPQARAPKIARLRDSQIALAGAVLAHAFQNDPLMVYTIPDAAERVTLLPEFYVRMVRFGFLSGEVYTTEGAIEGAAVWLPPHVKWDRESIEAAGLDELSRIIGDEAMGRFREVVGPEARARERDMAAPYWYLLLLGVAPNRQRHGLGGRLMEPILDRAKRENLACYLETEQPRNVAFYLKHGFEAVVAGEAAGASGVRFWTFRRLK
jgi:GNAT superfamily N-acetyltransferase